MKSFLKVSLLLGSMVVLLLAVPAIASHVCGGLVGGMAALGLLIVLGVLFLGLLLIGGGTAAVVGLAVLVVLGSVVLAVLLPIALPVLVVVGLIALVTRLARRSSRTALVG